MGFNKIKIFYQLCIYSVIFTICALIVVIINPSTGYELSIYTSTPVWFWVLVFINFVINIALLIHEATNNPDGKRWFIPLSILIANGIMVLLLSVIRNYYSVGSDTLMHIGYVKDLANGIVSAQNCYPALHVIPALFVKLGFSALVATNIFPVFAYIIYIVSFYFLSREIWHDNKYTIITTTLSALLLLPMGVGMAGTLVGTVMFPLTLFLIMRLRKNFNIKYLVIFILLFSYISLLHPLAMEVSVIALVICCFIPMKNWRKFIGMTVVLTLFAMWWYGYWYDMNVVGVVINDVLDGIFKNNNVNLPSVISPPPVATTGSVTKMIQEAGSNGVSLLPVMTGIKSTQTVGSDNMVLLLIGRYGSEILLGIWACVSVVLLIWQYIKNVYRDRWYIYFIALFVLLNMMWVAGWYLQLSVYDLIFSRMLNWIPPLSIILITPIIIQVLQKSNKQLQKYVRVCLLISIIAIGSVFNLYHSPIMGVPNAQITRQSVRAVDWLLEYGNPKVPIVFLNSHRVSRFIGAKYGVEWVRNHQKDYWLHEGREVVIDYNKNTASQLYPDGVYIMVTKMDIMMPRWENDKLYSIFTEETARMIYKDDNEIEIWYVEGDK